MSNVVNLPVVTTLDWPAERVLQSTMDAAPTDVVVVGWDQDGGFYFASSYADGAQALWLLAMAQKKLLEIGDPEG